MNMMHIVINTKFYPENGSRGQLNNLFLGSQKLVPKYYENSPKNSETPCQMVFSLK